MEVTLSPRARYITILISGAPGTGKSTLCTHAPYFFRSHWGETAVLSVDEFYRSFDPQWTTNNREWWSIATAVCLDLAVNLFQRGIRVVVIEGNGLYTVEAVNTVLQVLAPVSKVYHITLDADLDVVITRITTRGDIAAHPKAWLAAWLDHIRSHYAPWTHVIDTSNLTPAEILAAIELYIANQTAGLPNQLA